VWGVRFIKQAQVLGFSLSDIQALLALRAAPRASCADVRWHAETKITEIDDKIAALVAMKHMLSTLVVECSGDGPLTDCPILEALDVKETMG
jgi:MerR family transcriptional regulator, copper efflux regulator